MKRIVLLLICLLGASFSAQAGELYRWVDAHGKVHYGDVIPVGADQIEEKKFSDAAAPDEYLSYETRRAQQNFPVTLYVADNCAEYCDKARDLLGKRGIPFSEKALRTKEEIDAFKALAGFDSVPALSIGRTILKGLQADQWNSELDIAGYPKTVPYRTPKKPAAPVAPPAAAPAASSTPPAAASQVAPTDSAAQ
ncbi:MAG: glutaredoxin family protein [Gallionella sp.]|nr:glutaredoxin family protein [Gallionella sp.]